MRRWWSAPFVSERIQMFFLAHVSMRIDPSQVAPQAGVFPSPAGEGAATHDTSETRALSLTPGYNA
jgi:hypothetical protein